MDKVRRVLIVLILLGALCFALMGDELVLFSVKQVAAQVPPTKPPAPTPTDTTAPPTDTPVTPPTPTNTTRPPQPTVPPKKTRPPKPPQPQPDCQSAVSGSVRNRAGVQVAGATVTIVGADWSNAMLTDDNGQYGFAGLCAGQATLQATLPDGQTSSVATIDIDGKNNVQLDLGFSTIGAAAAETAATPQQVATPEPSMPETGYSGWLLVGGALLGVLLLLFAGARRVFGAQK